MISIAEKMALLLDNANQKLAACQLLAEKIPDPNTRIFCEELNEGVGYLADLANELVKLETEGGNGK